MIQTMISKIRPRSQRKFTRVLVFGSRTMGFNVRSAIFEKIGAFLVKHKVSFPVIVAGDAEGADKFAIEFAIDNDLPWVPLCAPWSILKKGAGHVRNWIAVQACDYAIGFWDNESTGTQDTLGLLKKNEKPFELWILGERGFSLGE